MGGGGSESPATIVAQGGSYLRPSKIGISALLLISKWQTASAPFCDRAKGPGAVTAAPCTYAPRRLAAAVAPRAPLHGFPIAPPRAVYITLANVNGG